VSIEGEAAADAEANDVDTDAAASGHRPVMALFLKRALT